MVNRAVVRDGKPYPPNSLKELEILPGVAEALDALHQAGFLLIVVTNQPDVATGKQDRGVVDAIHDKLLKILPLDDIMACFCIEGPDCDCYKPKPGMLLEAAAKWSINLKRSFIIGDRWRDIGAGRAVGCRTFFVDYGYEEQRPENSDHVVSGLSEAGRIILRKDKYNQGTL